MWNPEKYIQTWRFACQAHEGQLVPGTELPYVNHIGNVAMEVMGAIAMNSGIEKPDLAVQCALLHDVIEDTAPTSSRGQAVTHTQLQSTFGLDVANGVLALTKDKTLPTKAAQMADSLARIKQQPIEVWLVKLADRITNLQPPPSHWNRQKINAYREEAKQILDELETAVPYLAARLAQKIDIYKQFCTDNGK